MTFNMLQSWLQGPYRRTLVMGIVNVTPDSFSDGGHFLDPQLAAEHAHRLVKQGADLLDLGAESTRPGSHGVDAAEQMRRLLPVIAAIRKQSAVTISIDTTNAQVAEAAINSGANLINDISAGRFDPDMLPTASRLGAPVILMHMQGTPATMQDHPVYSDVTAEVKSFLAERLRAALAAGIPQEHVLLDPGIGFGKNMEHNLTLLRQLREFTALGQPLVIGTSRKGFIGRITGESIDSRRVMGTAATVAWSVANGAGVVRVHDVEEMAQVVAMANAILHGSDALPSTDGGAASSASLP